MLISVISHFQSRQDTARHNPEGLTGPVKDAFILTLSGGALVHVSYDNILTDVHFTWATRALVHDYRKRNVIALHPSLAICRKRA